MTIRGLCKYVVNFKTISLKEDSKQHHHFISVIFLLICIGVAPKKKVVRPIFFCRRGLSPVFLLGICTKINSCAFSAK